MRNNKKPRPKLKILLFTLPFVACIITIIGGVYKVAKRVSELRGPPTWHQNTDSNKPSQTAEIANPKPEDNNYFAAGQPLPQPYRLISPGVRLSLAKLAYPEPQGKLSYENYRTWYEVVFDAGPFVCMHLLFCEKRTDPDPEIYRIVFVFRDIESAALVTRLALLTFGTDKVTRTFSDSLIWENIGDFQVLIRQHKTYEVEKATITHGN